MARDYRAMEEEFIADLKSRSGRSLAEWMAAIDAKGLADRDEIIDWLHPQGFTFEHASWLERIHNNGGRAIYGEEPIERGPQTAPPRREAPSAPPPSPPHRIAPAFAPVAPPPAADPDALAALLARGKAYRMLAELVIAEARRTLPDIVVAAHGDLVSFCHPRALAVMAVTPRELRLGMALGSHPMSEPLVRAKGLGGDPSITHMLLLNDARQVDQTLMSWLRLADSTVNPATGDH